MWNSRLRLSVERSSIIFAGSSPVFAQLPDVEIIWKSCGKQSLTGFSAARYVCRVSRTVGFAFVCFRLD